MASEASCPNPASSCGHLSAVAGVAHRFHNTCGKNVTLEEDGTRAVRAVGYSHGLVFSTKELKAEEVFEVGCGDAVGGVGSVMGPANSFAFAGEGGRAG